MDQKSEQNPASRVTGLAALRIHLGLFFCLLICIPAGIFELSRALGGNSLSWAYVFEWPLFAGFGFYMWWKLLKGDQPTRAKPQPLERTAKESEQLAAWNAYLEQIHAEDEPESL